MMSTRPIPHRQPEILSTRCAADWYDPSVRHSYFSFRLSDNRRLRQHVSMHAQRGIDCS